MSLKKKSEGDKLVAPAQVWATLSRPKLDRALAVLIQVAEEMIESQIPEDESGLMHEWATDENVSFNPPS